MFALLLTLVGEKIISRASTESTDNNYAGIMHSNGADGPRFVKPQRGHEDGCVNGVCFESHAGEFAHDV
jgi:hypothetical protein